MLGVLVELVWTLRVVCACVELGFAYGLETGLYTLKKADGWGYLNCGNDEDYCQHGFIGSVHLKYCK